MNLKPEELEKLELLKKQRSSFKGQLTAFKNKHGDGVLMTLGACESVLHRIRGIYDKYYDVQSKIELLDISALGDRDSFEDSYGEFETIILNQIHDIKKSESTGNSSANNSMIELSNGCATSLGIRLPEVKLPKFNGFETEWLAFRDTFQDLVHKRVIDNSVKFHYLVSHIREGKAFSLIEHIPVTADNYELAWQTLCNKYNNEIAIQRIHVKALYEVKPPVENSSKSLQSFVDYAVKHYNALKSLKVDVDNWNLLLIHHLLHKLDSSTRVAVINATDVQKVLKFEEFIKILHKRVQLLEAIKPTSNSNSGQYANQFTNNNTVRKVQSYKPSTFVSNAQSCYYCNGNHRILECHSFSDIKLTPKMRLEFIRSKKLCSNCLIAHHNVRDCEHPPCSKCSLKHNGLLHFNTEPNRTRFSNNYKSSENSIHLSNDCSTSNKVDDKTEMCSSTSLSATSLLNTSNEQIVEPPSQQQVLLGTVIIKATSSNGSQLYIRALLDSGSHLNFITDKTCRLLNIKRLTTSKQVSGIGGDITSIKYKVFVPVASRINDFTFIITCYTIPKITNDLPSSLVKYDRKLVPSNFELADPHFFVPQGIDMLIGAELYHELFSGKTVRISTELPPFHESVFGYVACGKINSDIRSQDYNSLVSSCHQTVCSLDTLDRQVRKFWELDTLCVKTIMSVEERLCEEHYQKNYKRMSTGRYVVAIPLNSKINDLGYSCENAKRQFLQIEKRLIRQPEIYDEYRNFMKDYLQLSHMVLASDSTGMSSETSKAYYLPHHYVLKESSTTTKLRVVFNASSRTSSNLSLNNCMMVGPVVQQDLFSIVIRFRKHRIAFSADIAKMYRQILIKNEQTDLQRIWWRESPDDPLKCYKLQTVTYGTASAPFLATRTLKQLALDEIKAYPKASTVLLKDFYVDDVLSGGDTVEEALRLKSDLISLLKCGGFELRKFSSNCSLLSDNNSSLEISLILGLKWNNQNDTFEMSFNKVKLNTACTKRNVLSEICQLFDPLGLCSPIILTAKLFMQKLWTIPNLNWDDQLPQTYSKKWIEFKSQLMKLQNFVVPRYILQTNYHRVELHGFGDASMNGFGCVFYVRSSDIHGHHRVRLVCSKSRVAPLKQQTIPRLELCAALLVAEVFVKLSNSLDIKFDSVYLWSDSEITLFRIKSEPHRYSTFVANRITQIQENSSVDNWHYVPSSKNPADCVSRGLFPDEFNDAKYWWTGPDYLTRDKNDWPKYHNNKLSSELINLEKRPPTEICNHLTEDKFGLVERFSSFTRLKRVTAWILRFSRNCKLKNQEKQHRIINELDSSEIEIALKYLVRIVQQQEFKYDIETLQKHKFVCNKSRLKSLSPFIDSDGILRVGGRLSNANIPHEQKHPILLPSNHHFSRLLVCETHRRLLHVGPQALLYSIRLNYWIIGGKNLCRKIYNECIRCFRVRPKYINEIMADLPANRVQNSRPFSIVGIDFCGPFLIKNNTRSKVRIKVYICLFICFAVKAVHLEMVADLSTQAFLACLRRFVSRRGLCSKIYSDNATNFVGARRELAELRELFLSQAWQSKAMEFCSQNGIQWLTIPPRSPHFGGLWEAAIKSAKTHMKRAVGTTSLNSDEFQTLMVQIEACLNSRPLTEMSNNPSDFTALTPGHFLIGTSITALPEPSLLELKPNRLSRYQQIQSTLQGFWKRWNREYLTELQHRHKWLKTTGVIKIGLLVLLHDDNIPPLQWPMGRIIDTTKGIDGHIRVVTVKTANSIFKRAVTRISPLPIETHTPEYN